MEKWVVLVWFGLVGVIFKGRLNRDDWQNSIFTHLAISLNLVLAGLRLGLKKSPSG
ncbi:hypothetical protein [uncultured Gammaproteobacteria bacterium]|nr:hypothetical protein [uncultured Gammaproteobacteria bacterium]